MNTNVFFFPSEIRRVLEQLSHIAGFYQKAEHYSPEAANATMESVVAALLAAWQQPNEYNISELDQHIQGFLKREKH